MIAYLPLAAIDLKPPPDGYPCIGDFTTTCLSFLFSGSRLHREPLDVALTKTPEGTHTFTLKKGFTRLTAPLLLLMIASDMDPIAGKDIGDTETHSFENIQLSCQGAERQRKDVMKLAARFELLIQQRRQRAECKDQSDEEILSMLIQRYNSFKANAALKRWDYNQDLEAILLSKPTRFTVEKLAMWQDYIGRTLAQGAPACTSGDTPAEIEDGHLKAAEYKMACANLAHDYREAVAYNLRRHKVEGSKHVAQVLHMRDQIEIGLDVVTQFTQKRALMVVGDKGQGLAAMQRRMVADGTNRFSAPVELTKMHHVGFIDFSKFGRLTMVEINAAVDWCKQILHQNENYSMVFAVAPLLASEGVLGGLRGEMRRIEDKLVDNGMECKTCSIPFDVSEYSTPESGTLFTHEQGTIKAILEAALSRVSTMKQQGCIIHHYTCYDGNLEKVVLDMMVELSESCYLGLFSQCSQQNVFEHAVTTVKDKLLEEWKQGANLVDPDWRVRLKNFDDVFKPRADARTEPTPAAAAEIDLGVEGQAATVTHASAVSDCPTPSALSKEKFEQQFPTVAATCNLNMAGQTVLCMFVDGKVFVSSPTHKIRLVGVDSSNPCPIFLYSAGSWLGDSSKAKDYISKAENQNKAVEFRLESGESKVVLEEQGTQGASDGPPSSLFTLIV
ncbi:unnamed protein product [Durusdinium trenchii]|uniref:Uncharacterized protein n=1 Tax=Durusdinium trenchii TaxID=1381693 RepID=A0ABP0QSS6_9DINO